MACSIAETVKTCEMATYHKASKWPLPKQKQATQQRKKKRKGKKEKEKLRDPGPPIKCTIQSVQCQHWRTDPVSPITILAKGSNPEINVSEGLNHSRMRETHQLKPALCTQAYGTCYYCEKIPGSRSQPQERGSGWKSLSSLMAPM